MQNKLLAARALGLGATLTKRHLFYEEDSRAALGLPQGVHSYSILPIGYPMGNFGPVKRVNWRVLPTSTDGISHIRSYLHKVAIA